MLDKLKVPLPEPLFTVETDSRAVAHALRFLPQVVPAGVTAFVLGGADHGRYPLWAALAASLLVLAIMVLTVGVTCDGDDE